MYNVSSKYDRRFWTFLCSDNDVVNIPLAIVIIGSIAIACLLIAISIILSNRTRGEKIEWENEKMKILF